MPRELIVVSREAPTPVHWLAAVAGIDPDLGVTRLWSGGALCFADDPAHPVLTALRSVSIDDPSRGEQLVGTGIPDDAVWWTEVYSAASDARVRPIVESLAALVGGTVVEPGDPLEADAASV